MDRAEFLKLVDAIEEHEPKLLAIPGIVKIHSGCEKQKETKVLFIDVFVQDLDSGFNRHIPKMLNGFKVRIFKSFAPKEPKKQKKKRR